jgi:tetratricopeptide (TPR) repeat protein
MLSSMRRGARRGLWLLACGAALTAVPAAAQDRWQNTPPAPYPYPQRPAPAPPPVDGGADLRRNLTTVGTNPENLAALIESGRAALRMGDAQAALTFFSRADELAPRDARIKAGMGSAMVHLGQPRPALTLFAEAVALGAPDIDIAPDRGLAHDLAGDPRAAQRDYASVLRRRDDAETRRRLALSLAISGQRDAALRLLDPQLRRGDRAAQRTQAFVLALTGDSAGAARVAATAMPGAGATMTPFFARLPALSPAQRAMAAHLGIFPSDGRAQYAANVDTTPDPGALALAGPAPVRTPPAAADTRTTRDRRRGAGSPIDRAAVRAPQAAPPPRRTPPVQLGETRVRRVPGQDAVVLTTRRAARPPQATAPPANGEETRPVPAAPAPPADVEDGSDTAATGSTIQNLQLPPAETAPLPVAPPPAAPPAAAMPPAAAGVDASILAGVRPGDTIAAPGFSLRPAAPAPAAPPPPPVSERRNSALSDIATVVNALPEDPQGRTTRPRAAPSPASDDSRETRATRSFSMALAQPSPSRHWVQVAGNIERASMAGEFRRLRGRAPLLNGMQVWATRPNDTSRLLIGPFGSARDAQSFVNQLATQNLQAFAWTSAAGQVIERLPAGR